MKDLAEFIPVLKYYIRTTQTWATSGNTHTVSNTNVKANSVIQIHHLDAYAGRWSIVCADGSFVITSSETEDTSPTFRYIIL